MTGLKILCILVLLIIGLCSIRVGADIDYTDGKLKISATLFRWSVLQIFPRPPKPEGKAAKPKKEKKKKEPNPEEGTSEQAKTGRKGLPLGLNLEEIIGLLKAVLRGLGRFRKFQVDHFLLHAVIGGSDPYRTAIMYGYLNAFLSAMAPVCENALTVKESDVVTDVDFTSERTVLDCAAGFSIRIGQIFGVINTIVFGALHILLRNRIRILREKRREKREGNAEEQTEARNGTEETPADAATPEQQEDERKADNGKE